MVFSCKRNRRLFTKMAKGTAKEVKLMFLKKHQHQAEQEKQCVNDSLLHAVKAFDKNEYKDTITHLENAIRSVNGLIAMNNTKKMYDKIELDNKVSLIMKQLEGKRQQSELIDKNLYEKHRSDVIGRVMFDEQR